MGGTSKPVPVDRVTAACGSRGRCSEANRIGASTELSGCGTPPRCGRGVLRLPPGADQLPAIASALALGPSLVIVPGIDDAAILAARIRRAGVSVAHLPEQWAEARSGST